LTTFIYAIFWEHYPSPFLGKEVVENVVKGLIMLEVCSPKNIPKKLSIFIVKIP
jgi:hypothetical protein